MNAKTNYDFPVKNHFHAKNVTGLDFDIKNYPDADLYVDLDGVRIIDREKNYKQTIKFALEIDLENDILENPSTDYVKIIFSGHRGTGKTQELRELHKDLNHPDRYFSVLIEMEDEVEIDTFQAEDYYILIILKLARELEYRGINSRSTTLDDIIKDWTADEEVEKEIKNRAGLESNLETEAGFNILNFFKTKLNIKATLASENVISKKIREKIKKNPQNLINQFNLVLSDVREDLSRQVKGRDILFIVDGSERIPDQVYRQLFVTDSQFLRGIAANVISSIRIDSFYDITTAQQIGFYIPVLLPMIIINDQSIVKLKEIITRRLDEETFFEQGVLEYFCQYSGGCIRQLIRIVNRAILYNLGQKIDKKTAEEVIALLGREMNEKLTSVHKKILSETDWSHPDTLGLSVADKDVSLLVFQLILLKYNGHLLVNPLIADKYQVNN
ncbi:MAG: hypothetical protein NW226_18585 [Microscillaceae bacterium]|nr:hypothetical protein [Microscillaceae bacterium]